MEYTWKPYTFILIYCGKSYICKKKKKVQRTFYNYTVIIAHVYRYSKTSYVKTKLSPTETHCCVKIWTVFFSNCLSADWGEKAKLVYHKITDYCLMPAVLVMPCRQKLTCSCSEETTLSLREGWGFSIIRTFSIMYNTANDLKLKMK